MGTGPLTQVIAGQTNIQKLIQKLDFVMEANTPSFGTFKIYKMQEKPYEYIMCKTYSAMVGSEVLEYRKKKYESHPQNKNIIPFDFMFFRQVQQKCGRHLELKVFCRYYFFTLEEAILKRVKKQSRFPEEDILYTIKTLISLYDSFHENNSSQCEIFRTTNIFLTPEGFLKVYPEIIDWREQYDEERPSLGHSIFSFTTQNQVELDLTKEKKQHMNKKQKVTDDVLDIGVVILSMVCVAKESDYRLDDEAIRMEIIKFVLNSYQDPDNKPLAIFKPLLKGIFQNSWQMSEIKKQIQRLQQCYQFRISNRIKIITSETEDVDLTTNSEPYEKQRQSRLKMMPRKHLVPGRIECISARNSASMRN